MHKIAMTKTAFRDLLTSISLDTYCGRQKDSYELPGRFINIRRGDTAILFAPGRYPDPKEYTEITAEVVSPDPVKVRIIEVRKPFDRKEAAAHSF